MITFKMRNVRLLCMNVGIIALLVSGGANADVEAGGYEPDSCAPHGAIFESACRGTFTQCECVYVPEGKNAPAEFIVVDNKVTCKNCQAGSTLPEFSVGHDGRITCPDCQPCPGAAENPTAPPLGTYYYHRLTTCDLGVGPTWDRPFFDPPFDQPLVQVPGELSCGHVVTSTYSITLPGTIHESHAAVLPYVVANGVYSAPDAYHDDWTHDCALQGTALVTKTQAMDGDLKVALGSTLLAGFEFTMPGSHPAAIVGFLYPEVVFIATCASGTPRSEPIPVNMPSLFYAVPANSSAWYPSGDQTSAATYQGSATVPIDFCDPGTLVRLQQGGTFSTNVRSTDKQHKVNVRWHYGDGTGGGWSGTYSVIGN